MRFLHALVLGVLIFAFSVVNAQSEVQFFGGSFEEMTAQASTQNKCYMVFFSKDNCIPCIKMKEDTFTDPELIHASQEKVIMFEALMPNLDAFSLAQEYGVVSYPTLLVFSPKGVLIGKLSGVQTPAQLMNVIRKLAS